MANLVFAKEFSVQFVKTLIELVQESGHCQQQLMQAAAISSSELLQTQSTIPYQKVIDLFNHAIAITCDPFIGLKLARAVHPGSFGVLGYTLMNCRNLREVLSLTEQFGFLVSNVGTISFEEKDGIASVHWDTSAYDAEQLRPAHEAFLAGWFLYSKWLIGDKAQLLDVQFRHSHIAKTDEYVTIFKCPVSFNAPTNALRFPTAYLNHPIHNADPEIYTQMLEKTVSLAKKRMNSLDISAQVILLIRSLLPTQQANLKTVATRLNMSERSLRRKLQDNGDSFQKVLNQERREIAIQHLQSGAVTIQNTALSLGYKDSSTFSNAFKTWFGVSPSRYQEEFRQRMTAKTNTD